MKVVYTAIEKVSGKKRDTGESYGPFYKLHFLLPFQSFSSPNRQVDGNGFASSEVNVSEQLYQKLVHLKPLSHIELEFEPDARDVTKNRIIDIKPL